MDTSPPFPIFYLIGLGQTLGAILGEPLERAAATSPDCVVVATKDENGFEISQLEPKEITQMLRAAETSPASVMH